MSNCVTWSALVDFSGWRECSALPFGRFSNLGTVCPPWNSNFVFTWDTVYIVLPIAVEVCEVESLWSTTEGALYYNIARQAFPDFYGVVWGRESLEYHRGRPLLQHRQASFSRFLWSCVRWRVFGVPQRAPFTTTSFSQLLWCCVRWRVSEHL